MIDILIPALVGLGAFAVSRKGNAAEKRGAVPGVVSGAAPGAVSAKELMAVPTAPPLSMGPNDVVVVGDIGFYPSQHPGLDPATAARYAAAYKKTRDAREKLVKIAVAEGNARVRERANDNRGTRVEEYQRAGGVGLGGAWCAAFEGWCLTQLYGTRPGWMTGSTSGNNWAVQRALKSGALSPDYVLTGNDLRANPTLFAKVQPGWFWINGKRASGDPLTSPPGSWDKGHTGIVISPYGKGPDNFTTVEGNTWRTNQGPAGEGVYFQDAKQKLKPDNIIFYDPIALTEALRTPNA